MMKTTKLPIPTVTIAVQIVISAAMQNMSTERICLANSTLLLSSISTLPNNATKKAIEYGDQHRPPYFSADAMHYLVERGVQHLLVDIPSIDKMHDEGRLTNHHIFWHVPEGTHEATRDTRVNKTVTEMIFVDDEISDGLYLLNLQVPAFCADAAPCRPVVYALSVQS